MSFQDRNAAEELEFTSDGLVHVGVDERVTRGGPPGLHYYFDASMRCVKVRDTDEFRALHNKLEAEGQVTKKLDARYYEELQKGVLFWDGETFVTGPTMNRRYREVAMK